MQNYWHYMTLYFCYTGCKLWLRATLSPSSLEALQDGEHEKQRRHFLYFLMHQVPVTVSSNFSVLMQKKV
ncbi:hypothetical protein ACS0TY_027568 [Phlomoides rotata]